MIHKSYVLAATMAVASAQIAMAEDLFPPNAKAGECYARVLAPAQYATESKQVLVKEAAEKLTVIPAQYEWVEESILVKEETEELTVIPATYKTIEETIMVEPEKKVMIPVPATYKNVEERIMIKPGYTTWKKGRGLIEKVSDTTGEIMCLVEVPPEYKTVTKRVIDQAASVREETVPAKFATIKKRVIDQPASVKKTTIPAIHKTVKVRKLVSEAKTEKEDIPATYATVTESKLVTESALQWRPVLCETNTSPDVIQKLQQALKDAGYNPGPVDGVIGLATRNAISQYQADKGLAKGQLTMETLKNLGVSI